jgi:hypothetical protein
LQTELNKVKKVSSKKNQGKDKKNCTKMNVSDNGKIKTARIKQKIEAIKLEDLSPEQLEKNRKAFRISL